MTVSAPPTMSLQTAMRTRPGMYVGDLGRCGCLRVVHSAIELLVKIAIGREPNELAPRFSSHASLDVTVLGNTIDILLNFDRKDARRIKQRAIQIASKFHQENLDFDDDQDVAYVIGLTKNAKISALLDGDIVQPFFEHMPTPSDVSEYYDQDSYLRIEFDFVDSLDPSNITFDYLQGFLEADNRPSGLIPRILSVR